MDLNELLKVRFVNYSAHRSPGVLENFEDTRCAHYGVGRSCCTSTCCIGRRKRFVWILFWGKYQLEKGRGWRRNRSTNRSIGLQSSFDQIRWHEESPGYQASERRRREHQSCSSKCPCCPRIELFVFISQAKKLVESVPQVLRDNLSKADAETMKAKVEAAGGVCVVEWAILPSF